MIQTFFGCRTKEPPRIEQHRGNAGRPAAGLAHEQGFAGKRVGIGFAQRLDHPGLEDRIGEIGHPPVGRRTGAPRLKVLHKKKRIGKKALAAIDLSNALIYQNPNVPRAD
jgi:hypothetical protein